MKKKTLTIVLFGRNDDYNGNYKYRLFTCLKFLEKSIIKNNLFNRININFIDWNSEIPFLKEKIFPKKILKIINIYTLSPEILKKNGFRERFNIQLCCNYGARRSRDDYIFYTNTDILITEHFLKNLFNFIDNDQSNSMKLSNNSLLIIPRKFIPPYVTESELDTENLEKYISYASRFFKEAGKISGVCSGLGGILGKNKVWHVLQGFKENDMKGHGWNDVELGILALKKGKLIDLDYFGLYLYDLQQSQILKKNINTNKYQIRKRNNPNWGMSNLKVKPRNPLFYQDKDVFRKNRKDKIIKLSYLKIVKALLISSITDYRYATTLLDLLSNRKERIINFFIRTDDFKVIEFLYYLSKNSFINYFIDSKNLKNFGANYLRFHYRLIKNPQKNIFKPYVDVNINKKILRNDLILFEKSIPNIFINFFSNKSYLKKNTHNITIKSFKFSLFNLLIFFGCLINYLNVLIQNLYCWIKKIFKFLIKK